MNKDGQVMELHSNKVNAAAFKFIPQPFRDGQSATSPSFAVYFTFAQTKSEIDEAKKALLTSFQRRTYSEGYRPPQNPDIY